MTRNLLQIVTKKTSTTVRNMRSPFPSFGRQEKSLKSLWVTKGVGARCAEACSTTVAPESQLYTLPNSGFSEVSVVA